MNIVKLFLSFIKIGLFTFGGGYAMLPLMENELVEKNSWFTEGELLDIFALSQVTPGPIAINAATFLGFRIAGFWGSFFATLGVVIPSFIIIILIAFFLPYFITNKWIDYAFEGIKVAVIVLMLFSLLKLTKLDKRNLFYYSVLIAAFIFSALLDFNVIILLIISMVVGITYSCLKSKTNNTK